MYINCYEFIPQKKIGKIVTRIIFSLAYEPNIWKMFMKSISLTICVELKFTIKSTKIDQKFQNGIIFIYLIKLCFPVKAKLHSTMELFLE